MREKGKIWVVLFLLFLQILLFTPLINANSLAPATVEGGGGASGGGGGGSSFPNDESELISLNLPSRSFIGQDLDFIGIIRNSLAGEIKNISLTIKYRKFNENSYILLAQQNLSSLLANKTKEYQFKLNLNQNSYYEIVAEMTFLESNTLKNVESRYYIYSEMGGAALSGNIYSDNYKLFLGSTNNLTLTIRNRGNETSRDGKYFVYYQKEHCFIDEIYFPCDTLMLLREGNFSIDPGTTQQIKLDFTPEDTEGYTFIVNLSAQNYFGNYTERNYILVSKSGSDLAIDEILLGEHGLTQFENSSIKINIYNDGDKQSTGAKYSVYYQDGHCLMNSNYLPCNNLTLIKEESMELKSREGKEFEIQFNFTKVGYVTLFFNVSSTNNIDYGDSTLDYAWIKYAGPDIRSEIINYFYRMTKGQPTDTRIALYNDGNVVANSVKYSIFIRKTEGGDWQKISNFTVPSIDPKSYFETNYPFIINEKGHFEVKLESDLPGDSYPSNDGYEREVVVVNSGPDINLDYMEFETSLVRGHQSEIYVHSENLGNVIGAIAEFNLYIDNNLVSKEYALLSYDEGVRLNFTAPLAGNHEFKVVATLLGDIDTQDNEIKINKTVFEKKTVNLTLELNNQKRYSNVFARTFGGWQKVTGKELTIETLVGNENLQLFLTNGYDIYYGTDYAIIEYTALNLRQNEKIDLKITPLINFSKGIKDVISINTSFDYPNAHIYIVNDKIKSDLSRGNISYFYCQNFSYQSNKCLSNWSESNAFDYGLFFELEMFFDSLSQTGNKFRAGGWGYTDKFIGQSTNLSTAADTLTNFILEKSYGSILFDKQVNIARLKQNPTLLDKGVIIEKNFISINDDLPELANKSAKLTLREIDMRNPIIIRNGVVCSNEICFDKDYNSRLDLLTFSVKGFSNYTAIVGEYCGNKVCSASDGESCSMCSSDCGKCPPVVAPTDDPVLQTMQTTFCTPRWNCNFGPCIDNAQSLICTDDNNCGILDGKPSQARTCPIESNCVDADGDGYGVGPDCLGIDVNDADSGNTSPQLENAKKKEVNKTMFYVIVILLLCAIIALSTILIYRYKKDHSLFRSP